MDIPENLMLGFWVCLVIGFAVVLYTPVYSERNSYTCDIANCGALSAQQRTAHLQFEQAQCTPLLHRRQQAKWEA